MGVVNCPSCRQGIDLTGIAPGAACQCPQCGHFFNAPVAASPPPLPAGSLPPRSKLIHGVGGFKPATSIWDVFDWRFERYVTPIIIRLSWKLSVGFCLLMLLAIIGDLLSSSTSTSVDLGIGVPLV